MLDILASSPLILLFSVIGLGYLLGSIRIFGFSFGVAAVLFVGMGFGAMDSRLALPEYIYVIGLVLFVYAIGLQAGPGFFASFRSRGFRFSVFAVLLLAAGAVIAVILWYGMGLSAPSIVGIYCGALTNTPALAATVEAIKNFSDTLPKEMIDTYLSEPVVTYYAPSVPVTTYYAPTYSTYYAPSVPVTTYRPGARVCESSVSRLQSPFETTSSTWRMERPMSTG